MKKEDLSFLLPSLKGNKEEISGVFLNSKKVTKSSLFIALKGKNYDGNDYINEAKEKGASLIFSDNKNSSYYIPSLKEHINEILIRFYNLNQNVKIIGITGTNGKSSVSCFIKQLLLLDKKKVKNFTTYNEKNVLKSNLTTPSYEELIYQIKENNNLDYLILECSSIGISEGRINNLKFDYKILTNIYLDHLDYHKTQENYQKSKILFLSSLYGKVIMGRKDYFTFKEYFKEKEIIVKGTYSLIKESRKGTYFVFDEERYKTKLYGKQNIENLTFAIALGKELKIKGLKKKVRKIEPLKGRFDLISTHPDVLIDYAHTESAMEQVLQEITRIFKKKIILVFGSGGNRDKTKRKEYGDIALRYAYKIIVTSDNPRFENELSIIDEIVREKRSRFIIEKERSKAIQCAFSLSRNDTIIVILGKGCEEHIEKDGKLIPYSDYEEVRKCLKNYQYI